MIAVLAALALAQAQAQPENDPRTTLDDLRQIYQTSCADRDFYTFNDVCNQIEEQVRQAEIAADRADRAARRKHPAPAPPAPAEPKADKPSPAPEPSAPAAAPASASAASAPGR